MSFWNTLKKIAVTREISLQELVLKIDNERADSGLSSAIRVYVRNTIAVSVAQKPKHPPGPAMTLGNFRVVLEKEPERRPRAST